MLCVDLKNITLAVEEACSKILIHFKMLYKSWWFLCTPRALVMLAQVHTEGPPNSSSTVLFHSSAMCTQNNLEIKV